MAHDASYHAIYVVLNDSEFLAASIRSIYPHITGATVITSYDRDRWDDRVEPDSVVETLLSRDLDPDRKINVISSVEVSEARLRNHAMAYVHTPRRIRRVLRDDRRLSRITDADYFWIVDADEIYDTDNIRGLKDYVRTTRAQTYLLHPTTYFRTWNWRIEEPGHLLAVMTPGYWFGHLRHRYVSPWVRAFQKLSHERVLPQSLAFRAFGARVVPREIATFHHGAYVGDRSRIEAKLARSGHRNETTTRWLEDVWDRWTPETRNFHPQVPESFPSATHVPTSALPSAITSHDWPSGWIERG